MKTQLESVIQEMVAGFVERNKIELPANFIFDLVTSKDPAHGDFACNAAFKLAKIASRKPSVIADDLIAILQSPAFKSESAEIINKAEVAGGGFINFYLKKASLGKILIEAHQKGARYGFSDFGKAEKVILEFVSANPTGPLTIAHGRQAAVGDSLVRILRATGHHVTAEYYLNDAGRQMNLLGASLLARCKQQLGQPLVLPEDGYQGEYLTAIADRYIKLRGKEFLSSEPESTLTDACRKFAGADIMEGIQKDLADIRVSFDEYFNETDLYTKGSVDKALGNLKKNGYLFEQDGALWFRSTDFGDDKDRVVRKSTGEFTYLAPDIAYHEYKFERGYSWLINFLGPDHHGYVPRLKAACKALGHDPDQLEVRIVQLTTLYRKGQPVRMSTRAGEFVTLRELVEEVGPDATRFFFVMRKIESHLDFDLDLAKEKTQDNPVYYLQYAHARIASLLKFANRPVKTSVNLELLSSQEEADLILKVGDYPQILIRASQALEPYALADYLRETATCFHKFYSLHRIVTDDEALTEARLLLADATRIVLRNGLELLGISQPESM